MGACDEGYFCEKLENEVKLKEPESLAIEDAVRVLLQSLGEDVEREGIKKTPLRVAKAFLEGTRGYGQNVKDIVEGALFPESGLDKAIGSAGGAGGIVIVRDLDLFSYCESCLLPFQVKCHVGYVPSKHRVLGLSKLGRVAEIFAKRLQEPHRLADEVTSALHGVIKPSGVAVTLQCLHISFLGPEPEIMVSSGSGVFEDRNAEIWGEFLSLLKIRGIKTRQPEQSWCPFCTSESANPKMVSAVKSIISSLGVDPSREELRGTPVRFLGWLMNFQKCNLDTKLNGLGGGIKRSGEKMKKIHSELNLSFWSQCEHHLLPFHGVVHIGYFCNEEGFNKSLAKSHLQSIVHFYGFKLQLQERLTRQIAETVGSMLGGDVMVVVEATHSCMISRGVKKFGSSTATMAVLGRFLSDSAARSAFLESIPKS